MATNYLYQDFILLDPCDAVAVDDYLKGDEASKGEHGSYRGSSRRKSFQSPTGRSGGTAHKSSLGKNKDANVNQSPKVDCSFGVNVCNMGPDHPAANNFGNVDGFGTDDRHSEPRDLDDSDDDENDPWKPLNPHEHGNLKVRPFRKGEVVKKFWFLHTVFYLYNFGQYLILAYFGFSSQAVKAFRRNGENSTKNIPITTLFPLARLHGTISPELTEMWERRQNAFERQRESKSLPLYEKVCLVKVVLR